jgi:ankyrin repeat protein
MTGKAAVNSRNNDGATPLNVAAKSGYMDIVESLRRYGGH